jgi:predicted Zn-dependent protease
VALAALAACATVPFTNRQQLVLLSPSEEAQLGAQAFRETVSKSVVLRNGRAADLVRDVGRRIAVAANRPDFRWEFVLLDSKEVNAFALPGGKTAVYRGILPVAQTTAGLAVVMGHEIGHAIARHGAERISQGILVRLGGEVLGAAAGGGSNSRAILAAYGLGSQLGVMLPFDRAQETEADVIGLMLMAKAGYDPREALDFWDRMQRTGGRSSAEFLSTHPSGTTRRATLAKHMPQALDYYMRTRSAPVERLD